MSDHEGGAKAPPFPAGSRVAGGALMFAAAGLGCTLLLGPQDVTIPPALAIAVAAIDAIAGVLMLAGLRPARMVVLAWAVIGAILVGAFGAVSGALLFACTAVAMRLAVVLLLAGTPQAGRLTSGIALAVVAWFALVGSVIAIAGKRFVAGTVMEDLPGGVVAGKKAAYRMQVPAGAGWMRLKDHVAHGKNAEADVWITVPGKDRHVLVIAETVEEGVITPRALADAIVKSAGTRYTIYKEISRTPLPSSVKHALVLHSRGIINEVHVEELVGIFIEGEMAYQVHAFTGEDKFAASERELTEILKTFEPPREPAPKSLPEVPIALPVPIPQEPVNDDGRDLRKMPATFLSLRARAAAAKRDYVGATRFEHWAVAGGGGSRYNLACYYSLSDDMDPAVYWLQQATIEEGVEPAWASKDKDLEGLRADKRWPAIRRFLATSRRYWAASGKDKTLLVLPKGYKQGTPIAAVVGLHGLGSTPDDFAGDGYQPLADALGMAFVGVSGTVPTGPKSFRWAEWEDEDRAHVQAALTSVADRVTIDRSRVVLIGFSQGAQMAAEIAARHPDEFAGAIIMSPGTLSHLVLDDVKPALAGHRFVLSVGAEEHEGNVKLTATDADQLRVAGAEVDHRAYPGMKEHSFPPDYAEALPRWVRYVLGMPEEKKKR